MKRLVICCDGTWNTPDQKDRGVGTGDMIDRIFGGMFGGGLRHNVSDSRHQSRVG